MAFLSRLLSVFLLLAVAALAAFWAGLVPQRVSPLSPLSLERGDQWFVDFKLAALRRDPALCRSVLDRGSINAAAVPDRPPDDGCGWTNAVGISQVGGASLSVKPLTCEMAAALALWTIHAVQPAARETFGRAVERIEHFGTYSCRNIGGSSRRSAHATANAIDVAGFTLEDGGRISVLNDWNGGGAKSAFLRRVYGAACRYFRVTLGPGYNPAHADHFHFDRSGFWSCR